MRMQHTHPQEWEIRTRKVLEWPLWKLSPEIPKSSFAESTPEPFYKEAGHPYELIVSDPGQPVNSSKWALTFLASPIPFARAVECVFEDFVRKMF